MNYYEAREILDEAGNKTGRYHYTCRNGKQVWAVGHCCSFIFADDVDHSQPISQWVKMPNPEWCGSTGHATKDEASSHYKKWVLDNEVRYDGLSKDQKRKCEVCTEWTDRFAADRTCVWFLCDAHRTRERVSILMGDLGSIISSY